ncbi:MAG: class I SAM-dependent methyltransferase [Planctomycetes bacterium]|nr:class I SAM-dependent methyltransferase [Planctomycetota bacterium]
MTAHAGDSVDVCRRRAARLLAAKAPPLPVDTAAIERFILRSGRPVPPVLVAGAELGELCLAFDELGATATGVDRVAEAVQRACQVYPAGVFVCAAVPGLPADGGAFEGVWCGRLLSHVSDPAPVLADLHRVLRAGGLLQLETLPGVGIAADPTSDGVLDRHRHLASRLEAAAATLDLNLYDSTALPDGWVRMLFRREY